MPPHPTATHHQPGTNGVPARTPTDDSAKPGGLRFTPTFATDGDPYLIPCSARTAEILDGSGAVIFRQENVTAPDSWSDQAVRVVASKYFHGPQNGGDDPADGGRESSVLQLVSRVAGAVTAAGRRGGCFASEADATAFHNDLSWLCLNQHAAFNSPVWFNVGLAESYGLNGSAHGWAWDRDAGEARPNPDAYARPQGSACYLQSVRDDMASICDLASSEMTLFKYGSGTGTDLTPLRSTKERLSGGGKPSGPVSFLKIYDAGAGVVKSGGVTRRAAKLNALRASHPDIVEFVRCKPREERKAKALVAAGFSAGLTGNDPEEAYASVAYQNVNLTVKVTDEFMAQAEAGRADAWPLRAVTTNAVVETADAAGLLGEISRAAWECGDPALQYEDTVQKWHTCPNSGPINTSNPCGEYLFLDDSACNLASLNLLKFLRPDGSFDAASFRAACRLLIAAQEILVDHACYPTRAICENSHRFRPLGLGYANLGSLLACSGLAYDSDEGRALAGAVTALMTAAAYRASAELAAALGPFDGFAANRSPMLAVVGLHRDAALALVGESALLPAGPARTRTERLARAAADEWIMAGNEGKRHGYRNAQVSLLAPTGTIGFMMDCDTLGVEPELALVKVKALAGGGSMTIANRSSVRALRALGYMRGDDDKAGANLIGRILDHIAATGSPEGSELRPEHRPVFDTAFPSGPSGRCLSWRAHVRMVAAVQPFLSGASSKTCNVPTDATPDDIREIYLEAWRLGLKSVTVYRDGSKGQQPLTAFQPVGPESEHGSPPAPTRKRLPRDCAARRHKFAFGGHEGYIHVGLFPDGSPGEVFVTMSKDGSTVQGLMDALGTVLSIALQYGAPLEVLAEKLAYRTFEPHGPTGEASVPVALSLADYLGRWLAHEFGPDRGSDSKRLESTPGRRPPGLTPNVWSQTAVPEPLAVGRGSVCPRCGSVMRRAGACDQCPNCFLSGGCG